MKKLILFSSMALAILSACKKEEKQNVEEAIVSGIKTISVPFNPTQPFTLFRFSDSSVVANSDSASNKWDFGMRFTDIIVNKAFRGPGEAGVILQDGLYDEITSAPATGYAFDTSATQKAIKSFNTWATYSTPTFIPKAGKVFIFRTADGNHYAKMEFLEITSNGNFTVSPPIYPTSLYYKIKFTYQPNESLNF
jgi:hypothetical protein